MAAMGWSKFKTTADQSPTSTHKDQSQHLPKYVLMIPKTFGKLFCGLIRQKGIFLSVHSIASKRKSFLQKRNFKPGLTFWTRL